VTDLPYFLERIGRDVVEAEYALAQIRAVDAESSHPELDASADVREQNRDIFEAGFEAGQRARWIFQHANDAYSGGAK